MKVHTALGPGFLEAVYHGALAIELRNRGVLFEREVPIPVFYEGEPVGAPYRADLVVPPSLLVELKAIAGLSRVEEAQVIHYLKATGVPDGLLINFGSTSLQVRRLSNRDRRSSGQVEFL